MPEPDKTLIPTRAPALASAVGLAIWLCAYFVIRPSWELAILWLGALVHLPLALSFERSAAPERRGQSRTSGTVPVLAALFLIAGFEFAWWLILPWVGFACFMAASAVWRIARLGVRRPSAIADFGLIPFAASSFAALAAAADWQPPGYSPVIVLLTAVHQLFIGVVLHTVASRIVAWRPGRLPVAAAVCVIIGNPLVATGIVVTHAGGPAAFEFAAATFFASAVIVLGWMQLFLALWPRSGLPWYSRVLLVISDLSIGTAMSLAIIYAWGLARGVPTLTIPEMIFWHGTLNAFGFGLCGLVGWWLAGAKQ
jgi:hypothetical protein